MFLSRVYCTIYYIFQPATLTLCCLILQVRGRRHLLFASQQQLEVLCRAKAWYIDGTFKLCRKLFSQLLIINAFVHIHVFICIFLIFFSGKKSASPIHADPAASRRDDPPNPNGFGAQTMQTSATNLPAAASKDLQPMGSVRERWSDSEAVAASLLRTLRAARLLATRSLNDLVAFRFGQIQKRLL